MKIGEGARNTERRGAIAMRLDAKEKSLAFLPRALH